MPKCIFNTGLVNGSNQFEGRVEVYVNGQWGTVCEDWWNLQDAAVACQQLGYGYPVDAIRQAPFGSNENIPILLDNLDCRGNENRLQDCRARVGSTSHNCDHRKDVGLICFDASKQICYKL